MEYSLLKSGNIHKDREPALGELTFSLEAERRTENKQRYKDMFYMPDGDEGYEDITQGE